MKIIFFLEYYFPNIGGVETLFKGLAERLSEAGHTITIITARPYPDSPLQEQIGNISIIRIPVRSRYIFTFLGFFYLIKHINKGDFIHTTSYNAAIPAFFAGKLFRKKVIVTFHEAWNQLWFQLPNLGKINQWGHYLFEAFLLKLPFDYFIGVSNSTADNLIQAGVAKKRVKMIYNGIDYAEFTTKKNIAPKKNGDPFVFTYFGRLGISKGLDLLLAAAENICTLHPHARLQLIIPKVPKSFLHRVLHQVQHSILKEKTSILHELPFQQLKQKIATADCIVIPSYSEGFCFAAAESVALGAPIISSNQMALREVVSGQFIKMEEFSIAGLEVAMQAALEGKWERTPVKRFELAKTIEQYIELYKELYS